MAMTGETWPKKVGRCVISIPIYVSRFEYVNYFVIFFFSLDRYGGVHGGLLSVHQPRRRTIPGLRVAVRSRDRAVYRTVFHHRSGKVIHIYTRLFICTLMLTNFMQLPHGDFYTIMPTTYSEGKVGPYVVSIMSEVEFSITKEK